MQIFSFQLRAFFYWGPIFYGSIQLFNNAMRTTLEKISFNLDICCMPIPLMIDVTKKWPPLAKPCPSHKEPDPLFRPVWTNQGRTPVRAKGAEERKSSFLLLRPPSPPQVSTPIRPNRGNRGSGLIT